MREIVTTIIVLLVIIVTFLYTALCSKDKVQPEVVALLHYKDETIPDYRCKCGYGVAEDYNFCPYCGAA